MLQSLGWITEVLMLKIAVTLSKELQATIEAITKEAQTLCPNYTIHSLLFSDHRHEAGGPFSSRHCPNLHISLTHPLPLRRSQVDEFRDGLRAALSSCTSGDGLRISLAGRVSGYVNGRRYGGEGVGGRAFLALRVSAGSSEVSDLRILSYGITQGRAIAKERQIARLVEQHIHPILNKLHLPKYHDNPQFHTSFAWCLADRTKENSDAAEQEEARCNPPILQGDLRFPASADPPPASSSQIPETPFTSEILDTLSDKFHKDLLSQQPAGGWKVDKLDLKVGKEIYPIPLV